MRISTVSAAGFRECNHISCGGDCFLKEKKKDQPQQQREKQNTAPWAFNKSQLSHMRAHTEAERTVGTCDIKNM